VAIALGFRVAIALGAVGSRVLRASEGPAAEQLTGVPSTLWSRLQDPSESNADLEAALSAATGNVWSVTNYAAPFELRKAQVRWGRFSSAAAGTDDAVTTHHFIKLSGGAISDAWVAADFIAAEARLTTFWEVIDDYYDATTTLKQIRWYKAGPAISPPQAPVRIVDPNNPGQTAGLDMLPPQVAMSVTEKTSDLKSWGRFYLPAPSTGTLAQNKGRMGGSFQAVLADAADVMYEGFITDGTPAVVYSAAKPSRPTAGGGTLPATTARALGVLQLQVDDLFDVIRSRRWNEPLLRLQRDVAGA